MKLFIFFSQPEFYQNVAYICIYYTSTYKYCTTYLDFGVAAAVTSADHRGHYSSIYTICIQYGFIIQYNAANLICEDQ